MPIFRAVPSLALVARATFQEWLVHRLAPKRAATYGHNGNTKYTSLYNPKQANGYYPTALR